MSRDVAGQTPTAHVWRIDAAAAGAGGLARLAARLLSDEEAYRHDRYRSPTRRRLMLIGRGLTRLALSDTVPGVDPLDWRFRYNAHGRPEAAYPITASRPRFNVAHSRDTVVCVVVHGAECGVDVEHLSRSIDIDAVASMVLSTTERRALCGAADDDRAELMLRYWTIKEAWAKALGVGMSADLRAHTVVVRPSGITLLRDGQACDEWHLELLRAPDGYLIAVAVRSDDGSPVRVVHHGRNALPHPALITPSS